MRRSYLTLLVLSVFGPLIGLAVAMSKMPDIPINMFAVFWGMWGLALVLAAVLIIFEVKFK